MLSYLWKYAITSATANERTVYAHSALISTCSVVLQPGQTGGLMRSSSGVSGELHFGHFPLIAIQEPAEFHKVRALPSGADLGVSNGNTSCRFVQIRGYLF